MERVFDADILSGDQLQNPVGSGDALAGGFLTGQLTRLDIGFAARLGQQAARIRLRSKTAAEAERQLPELLESVTRQVAAPVSDRWDAPLQEITRDFGIIAQRLSGRPVNKKAQPTPSLMDVRSEYGLHHLLAALLHTKWDNVRREEAVGSYAGRGGTPDFGIRELRAHIECKFIGARKNQRVVTDVIDDICGRYSRDLAFDRLFIFVYDPFGRINTLDELKGLEGPRGGFADVRIGVAS